jgi:hypothetical protein
MQAMLSREQSMKPAPATKSGLSIVTFAGIVPLNTTDAQPPN